MYCIDTINRVCPVWTVVLSNHLRLLEGTMNPEEVVMELPSIDEVTKNTVVIPNSEETIAIAKERVAGLKRILDNIHAHFAIGTVNMVPDNLPPEILQEVMKVLEHMLETSNEVYKCVLKFELVLLESKA